MSFLQAMINEISLLKEFVLLSIACTLLFLLYYHFGKKNFSLTSKKARVLGLFLELKGRAFYLLVALSLNFLFLLSCLLRYQPLRFVHVCTLVLLLVVCLACLHDYKAMLSLLFNQALAGVSLVIVNMLVSYLHEVRFEWTFFGIYLVASSFLCLYFLYMYLNQLRMIMKEKFNNEKKRKSKPVEE